MLGPALTPRERAVLAAVERRLTNPEIASELFISVRTVESHIASLRRKLGADTRGDLIAAARELRETSVRVPANPLRGRGRDLAELAALLDAHRWVTIVGPGGVGKTRLALEFARTDAQRTPLVVELEHAGPGDILARLSRALDLEGGPGRDLIGAVAVALSAQDYVLVLDNADRVGPATADAVAGLRARAPGLRVIVTSRTALGGVDESVHVLRPLAANGVDSPAAALLADRLAATGHALDAQEQQIAERIGERLDGLPLALELAASVARHLPLGELDRRLSVDLASLDRAVPEGRHRTLETAFDWTWDLLTDEEQDVLRRLGALPRTFDFDLAVAVSHPGAEKTVLRLLDHSLIVPVGGEPIRFRLLAVLREFVHARTDPALIRRVLERHAEVTEETAGAFAARARVDASPEAMMMSALLCPEVNAALRWSLAARHPAAVALAGTLAIGVEQYGSDVDSVTGLATAADDEWLRAEATPQQLLSIGTAIAFYDVDRSGVLAEYALAAARDDDGRRAAHQLAGFTAAYQGDRDAALAHLDEAERLALALGLDWELGAVRQSRGVALRGTSPEELAAAIASFESAMRAYARAGDLTHVNNVRYMMAAAAADSPLQADHDRAAGWAAECRAYAEATLNDHEIAHARLVQATLGLEIAGELGELLDAFRHHGDLRCVNRTLLLCADRTTDPRERLRCLASALDIAQAAGDVPRQLAALQRSVVAQYDVGDRSGALAALDRIAQLGGVDAADEACPPELRAEFARS
ncbi:ATP-binding protein [Microbacterium sp. SSM24]|uniref:ATP-binding protein n=1 Tax=Microbacterium sp. SSM24 TaxID=2991714 RepID=UPI002225CFA3|nr:LuxR C-terminal-related transcriptional regulator [Microbacterium sp. SSM24]MCW3491887.1 LuxR C-terminal-related transcriptional regulator [Microbacterium sp. SSM24]